MPARTSEHSWTLKGKLFDLLEKSETYIKEHINWKVVFGKLERQEIPEIPVDALREALVNSLCHRDYRVPKGNEVAIFKDRVEIYNPGDFPEGYKPEDFIRGEERSILRNPLIAEILFKSKDIERWGSGLKRIVDECVESGIRVDFKALKSGFLVIFHRQPMLAVSPSTEEKTTGKTTGKTGAKARDRVLALIRANPEITVKQLAEVIGLSTHGVDWHIRKLKQQGWLKRIGSRKAGRWEVLG